MPPSTPSLFRDPAPSPADLITAHCDGGARGNPGPAGFGVQITDASGNVIAELSEFLGFRTNNFAEYSGLLAALDYALAHGHKSLRVISDSELMVKQIQGKYKVNSPDLKPLWQEAKNRIARLDRFEITHALRHKNKDADRLANQAMDRGMKRGPEPNDRGVKRGPEPDDRGIKRSPDLSAPGTKRNTDLNAPSELSSRSAAEAPASPPPRPTPAMLRGFARDGVIHILGPHTLPNGAFVKIIPE